MVLQHHTRSTPLNSRNKRPPGLQREPTRLKANTNVVANNVTWNMSTDQPKLEVDGEHHILQDKLLEELVGNWNVTGRIAGQQFEQYCDADWVLNHQFLRVHFIDSAARNRESMGTPSNAEYEAMVFIGNDNRSETYVVQWIDISGRRLSEK